MELERKRGIYTEESKHLPKVWSSGRVQPMVYPKKKGHLVFQ